MALTIVVGFVLIPVVVVLVVAAIIVFIISLFNGGD